MKPGLSCKMPTDPQRRHFTRIPFDASYRLIDPEASWQGSVIDLSLKGAMLSRPAGLEAGAGDKYELELQLSQNEIVIRMQVHIAHLHPDCLGVACDYLDLDSMTHLRRFLELNLGDSALLEREISEMFNTR